MNRRALLASAVLAASIGLPLPASAQTSWTMASGYPESSFFTQNIRQMVKEIEEKSGGKLKIDLRSNDSLIKLDAVKRAVQSGQVQMGEIRLGVYGNEGAMYNLDNIPGVATTFDQATKLTDAQRPFFDELFKKNGMRAITYVAWPGQGFYTKQPLKGLADLKGQKLRIYSKQTQIMGEKLGMEALILPFAEVPQAFSTGMIQSLWTSAQTGTDVQVWDYVKNFTYTGTMHNKNAILVNERAFRQLDAATQKVVLEAGEAATKRGWELAKKASEERENVLKSHGMTIAQSPKDILDAIEGAGKAMVQEWLAAATAEEKAVYENYQKSLK
ncbi:MAG TPA: TRAP transporter substrate-binding protein [Bosea sp. (in: a-proteobacteria)]|jgi:TRAP-type C4-dicarboxylate transport system substrate-binding protein|uniref:TRAP transporter substrate-binding protein n=1 Tax=Bosea sp. (in: a-proteobacteria) TaxID=1871050 RepID=UPI002E1460C1|nr:TRAP transporter substrate-binding protein [Bosea sp. (in: a-proteobacteria)]